MTTPLQELEAALALEATDSMGLNVICAKHSVFLLKHADLLRQRLVDAEPAAWRYRNRSMRWLDMDELVGMDSPWATRLLQPPLIKEFAYAAPPNPTTAEPVAWRVKDFADGWILCQNAAQADACCIAGNLIQPLYAAPPNTLTFDEARACVPAALEITEAFGTDSRHGFNAARLKTLRNIDERERRG